MNRLLRILAAGEDIAAAGATLLFVGITVSICAEVLLRYGFNSPIAWVVEVTEYSLLWITFLGAAWVLRHGGHVRVDILLQYLSPAALRMCGLISSAMGALTSAILLGFGAHATYSAMMRGAFKPTGIDIPTWMIIVVIPAGGLLLMFRFARLFAEYWTHRRDFGAEPSH